MFDGDSIEVSLPNDTRAEVRLIGINAPEGSECHGDLSKQALEDLLEDSDVTVSRGEEDFDQFGRLLRYVFADDRNTNFEQVVSGNALALQSGHELEPQFVTGTDNAVSAGLGMWSAQACGAAALIPDIEIRDYVFDPQGRDTDNANAEYVEIGNAADGGQVSMAKWILRDESTQHRFVFPDSFVIQPGDSVKVHSGCGSPSQRDLYWCASDPVWSNGGDTIILQLENGTVVARKRFAGNY